MSNNRPQFSSAEFAKFGSSYGFIHVTSDPSFPQSNGEAARGAVKIVKRLLHKASDPYMTLLCYKATLLGKCFEG